MQSIKIEVEDVDRRKTTMDIGIGLTVKIEINPTKEVEETFTITEITDPIIELGVDQEIMGMEMVTEGTTVDKIIEETVIDKTVVIKGIGIEAQVKTAVGLGQDIEAILETTIGISPITEIKVEIEIDLAVEMKDKGPGQNPETGIEKIGLLQGLDPVPE